MKENQAARENSKVKQSKKNERNALPHLCKAYFLRFMAANLSLTQLVTRVKLRRYVKRMACFSFASAKTRSIVSLRRSYSLRSSGVCR